jgi:hypothetical protein
VNGEEASSDSGSGVPLKEETLPKRNQNDDDESSHSPAPFSLPYNQRSQIQFEAQSNSVQQSWRRALLSTKTKTAAVSAFNSPLKSPQATWSPAMRARVLQGDVAEKNHGVGTEVNTEQTPTLDGNTNGKWDPKLNQFSSSARVAQTPSMQYLLSATGSR